MKKKQQFTDKTYRLLNGRSPLSYMLSSRHSSRSPLLWFDEETGQNKALRYARNQRSPFEEEQDGNAVLEPIIFEDGMLIVNKQDQSLQKFLHYHPGNGSIFAEVNHQKDAARELEYVEKALDAQIMAKNLSLEKLLMVSRVLMGSRVDKMSTQELKRDILVYSKNEPQEFMSVLNDPMLDLQDMVYRFFEANLLTMRNSNKDVYYNLKKNKQKMLTVPYGQDSIYIVASYFQSDEGVEAFKMLKSLLNKDKK
tara:strand:+ start:237 stop:995 length:759 start_codon:yes stop_codon:yes gene_type:complete